MSYQNLVLGTPTTKPNQNLNVNSISCDDPSIFGDIRVNSYEQCYNMFNLQFLNVAGGRVEGTNYTNIKNENPQYVGIVDPLNTNFTIEEDGIYGLSFSITNDTSLPGSGNIYKISMEEIGGMDRVFSRTLVCRNEPPGDLNILVSATLFINGGTTWELYCQRIDGTSSETFNCLMSVVRIK